MYTRCDSLFVMKLEWVVKIRYVTLQYVMLRYVALRRLAIRYVMLGYVTLRHVTLYYVTWRDVMLCYVTIHYVTWCYVTLRYNRYITLRYVTLQDMTWSDGMWRYVTLSRCAASHLIASHSYIAFIHRKPHKYNKIKNITYDTFTDEYTNMRIVRYWSALCVI